MGQQQLILLVLATVIVGIAIVVGIAAFTENSAKANADAMMQDAVRISNDMQAWKKKPAPFGGQAAVAPASVNTEDDFTGATFPLLGYALAQNGCAATEYGNLNGCFSFLNAPPTTDPIIQGRNVIEDNTVQVQLCGMDGEDIDGTILVLNGAAGTALPGC